MSGIKALVKKIIGERGMSAIRVVKQRNRRVYIRHTMLQYGEQALKTFDEVNSQLGSPYWLMYGTLLGAVREKGFIKHDDDIDVGMFCDDINKALIEMLVSKGFTCRRAKMSEDRKYKMLSFMYHDIVFDVYGFLFDDDSHRTMTGFQSYPIEGDNLELSHKLNLYRVCLTHMEYVGFKRIPFMGSYFMVPENDHQLLTGLYGADYMTPIKGKKAFSSPIIEILPKETLTASVVPVEEID